MVTPPEKSEKNIFVSRENNVDSHMQSQFLLVNIPWYTLTWSASLPGCVGVCKYYMCVNVQLWFFILIGQEEFCLGKTKILPQFSAEKLKNGEMKQSGITGLCSSDRTRTFWTQNFPP